MTHVHFDYMTMSMSAYDAARLISDKLDARAGDFQLARAADGDPHHEIEFHMDYGDPEDVAWVPGNPVSPLIVSATLSASKFYVEFRFKDTPVYMTIAATSTVTVGWLERTIQ